jgi:hypothetical protein
VHHETEADDRAKEERRPGRERGRGRVDRARGGIDAQGGRHVASFDQCDKSLVGGRMSDLAVPESAAVAKAAATRAATRTAR